MASATRGDAGESYDVEISREIDAVLGDWEVLEREGLLTPFQTRAWLVPFYRGLAPSLKATPIFVLVRDRLSRRPLMLLPLCGRRYFGLAVVQFADLGVSDYNAPVIDRSFNPTPEQWRRLWRRIVAAIGKGSVLRLKNMPHLVGGRPNLLLLNDNSASPMELSSWGVKLPLTMEEYRTRVLPRSFAKELAKKNRRVAKRGDIEFVAALTRDDRRVAFDALARQRRARCAELGRHDTMTDEAYRKFYEAAAVETPDELASLYVMKVGGEVVGVLLALNHQDSFLVIMSTFEGGEWRDYSIGNVMMLEAVANCIGNGVGFFDLTIGNETYKKSFGATPSPLYAAVQPLTPFGAVIISLWAIGAKLGPSLRKARALGLRMFSGSQGSTVQTKLGA